MRRRSVSTARRASFTADGWHVVHARWSGSASKPDRFERELVSEHPERSGAYAAARALAASLSESMRDRAEHERDQIFVREPGCWSLEIGRRRAPRVRR